MSIIGRTAENSLIRQKAQAFDKMQQDVANQDTINREVGGKLDDVYARGAFDKEAEIANQFQGSAFAQPAVEPALEEQAYYNRLAQLQDANGVSNNTNVPPQGSRFGTK